MQIDDDTVKANCFRLLLHLLERAFDKNSVAGDDIDCEDEWSVSFNPEKTDAEKAREDELAEARKCAQEDLFQFMSPIVSLVIQFELSLADPGIESGGLTMISVIGHGSGAPRLGLMRLAALELLDKLQKSYGLRMLCVYKEADLFTTLLKLYSLYPFNDVAHSLVTSILAHALNRELALAAEKKL